MIIHNIAVVGGFRGFETDQSSNDYRMVMPALDYLRQTGIPVSSQPDFDAINFADKRNFLDEDNDYDLVFIAHIPNGRNLSWTRMSFNTYSQWTDVSKPEILGNTIDRNNSADRWAERIAKTNAKIVMSVGTAIEITGNYLHRSSYMRDYISLISPNDDASLVGRADIFATDQMKLLYGQQLDLPYQWLGISMDKIAMQELGMLLDGETDLARIIVKHRSGRLQNKNFSRPHFEYY